MEHNAIELSGLTKRYADFTLGPVNLTLPAVPFLGLIGENGAGKTTLIKTMLGVARPDGGTVRLLGREAEQPKQTLCGAGGLLFLRRAAPTGCGPSARRVYPTGTGRCLSRTSTNSAWQIKSIRHCPGACG